MQAARAEAAAAGRAGLAAAGWAVAGAEELCTDVTLPTYPAVNANAERTAYYCSTSGDIYTRVSLHHALSSHAVQCHTTGICNIGSEIPPLNGKGSTFVLTMQRQKSLIMMSLESLAFSESSTDLLCHVSCQTLVRADRLRATLTCYILSPESHSDRSCSGDGSTLPCKAVPQPLVCTYSCWLCREHVLALNATPRVPADDSSGANASTCKGGPRRANGLADVAAADKDGGKTGGSRSAIALRAGNSVSVHIAARHRGRRRVHPD